MLDDEVLEKEELRLIDEKRKNKISMIGALDVTYENQVTRSMQISCLKAYGVDSQELVSSGMKYALINKGWQDVEIFQLERPAQNEQTRPNQPNFPPPQNAGVSQANSGTSQANTVEVVDDSDSCRCSIQ
tara:strand:+ start:1134 stop:1523 length:390 start_codon:yes stop_codon:yes gene_type:complete